MHAIRSSKACIARVFLSDKAINPTTKTKSFLYWELWHRAKRPLCTICVGRSCNLVLMKKKDCLF